MKNLLWYLGFLSILSLLYFIEGKAGFLGFLGFMPYFSIYKMDDERMERNIGMATRNAFVYTIFFGSVVVAYGYITKNIEIFPSAFVLLFGGALLISLLSLYYYDKMGRK